MILHKFLLTSLVNLGCSFILAFMIFTKIFYPSCEQLSVYYLHPFPAYYDRLTVLNMILYYSHGLAYPTSVVTSIYYWPLASNMRRGRVLTREKEPKGIIVAQLSTLDSLRYGGGSKYTLFSRPDHCHYLHVLATIWLASHLVRCWALDWNAGHWCDIPFIANNVGKRWFVQLFLVTGHFPFI